MHRDVHQGTDQGHQESRPVGQSDSGMDLDLQDHRTGGIRRVGTGHVEGMVVAAGAVGLADRHPDDLATVVPDARTRVSTYLSTRLYQSVE